MQAYTCRPVFFSIVFVLSPKPAKSWLDGSDRRVPKNIICDLFIGVCYQFFKFAIEAICVFPWLERRKRRQALKNSPYLCFEFACASHIAVILISLSASNASLILYSCSSCASRSVIA